MKFHSNCQRFIFFYVSCQKSLVLFTHIHSVIHHSYMNQWSIAQVIVLYCQNVSFALRMSYPLQITIVLLIFRSSFAFDFAQRFVCLLNFHKTILCLSFLGLVLHLVRMVFLGQRSPSGCYFRLGCRRQHTEDL